MARRGADRSPATGALPLRLIADPAAASQTPAADHLLAAAFAAAPDCLAVLDADGRLLQINPAGQSMLPAAVPGKALAEAIATHPAADYGAIAVLDPDNGAVRALATYPTYDPKAFDPLRGDSEAAVSALLNDPSQPLLNRATQGAYPAGSTFKIVTYAAALNSGLYDAARKEELRQALADQAAAKTREAELEEQWLEALERLESLQAELEGA